MLRAIVAGFIHTGEPVASAAVASRGLGISAATIRVAMAELTEAGLLAKPHASSGRVPTPGAFRLYVDRLIRRRVPSRSVREQVSRALSEAGTTPTAVLRAASHQLASRCIQAAVGRMPAAAATPLRRIELVRIDVGRVLVVAILEDGRVRHHVAPLDSPCTDGELVRTQNLFNEEFAGCTLETVRARLRDEVAARRRALWAMRERALRLAEHAIADRAASDDAVVVTGRTHVLAASTDAVTAADILTALDDEHRLLAFLDGLDIDAPDSLRVAFGDEIEVAGLRSCTVIAARFETRGARGTVAIVGPVRMDYGRVIPLVGYTAGAISGILRAAETAA